MQRVLIVTKYMQIKQRVCRVVWYVTRDIWFSSLDQPPANMPPRRSPRRSAAASTIVKKAKSGSQSRSATQTDDE